MQDIGHVKLDIRRSDGQGIRIVQLTDLHQWPRGVNEFEAHGRVIDFHKEGYSSQKNIELVEHVMERTEADMVVLTGDIIDGRPCADMEGRKFLEVFKDVIKPLLDRNIPWTFIPGNHDDDFNFQKGPWSRNDLLDIYKLPGCVSAKATSFNHTLTVSNSPYVSDGSMITRLWLFDSGTNTQDEKLRYTTFNHDAVKGYKELSESTGFNPGNVGLAYGHIPLPQMEGLRPLVGKNAVFNAALLAGKVPFPFNYQPFTSLVRLLGRDLVAGCSKGESNIFDTFKAQGNILAYFCGHDHQSDWIAMRDHIYLGYGRCGGFTPPSNWEGAAGKLPFQQGARVVEVDAKGEVNTWVCTFDNNEEDRFKLINYGQKNEDMKEG